MKLVELFTKIPEDFAISPMLHADSGNVPVFDPQYSKIVGSQDGYDVWGSREKEGFDIYGFRQEGKTVAFVALADSEVKPNFQKFHQLWVSQEFRRRGLGAGLIFFLIRKLGINLVLDKDEIVSTDARKLFLALHQAGKIKISSAGTVLSNSELTDIFNDTSHNNISLVIHERKADVKLFAAAGIMTNNKSRLIEKSYTQVFQLNAEYD